jgi:hypothetical protein
MIAFPIQSRAQNGFCRLFDSKYGFKQKSINAIVKDKNGIVWLGTESGLVKFDGLSFCEIIPSIEKYKKSEIVRIKIKENIIYLVYRNKGCLTYNINTYKFIEISKVPIFDIAAVTDNIYYTINYNGVLLKHIGSKTIKFKKLSTTITIARIEYFANRLFLATDDGLFRINGITNAFEYGSNYDDFKYDLGDNFEFDVSEKYLHFINAGSVYLLDSTTSKNSHAAINLVRLDFHENITAYHYENKSLYYFIFNKRKVVRGEISGDMDTRTIYNLNYFDNLQYNYIAIFDSSSLLIGTNQGLLWLYKRNGEFGSINDNQIYDSVLRVRRSILELNKDELLFFGDPSVIKYNRKTNNFQTLISKGTYYNSVLVNNKIYVSTEDSGLVRLNDDHKGYEKIYTIKNRNRTIAGLLYDADRNLIIAGGNDYVIFYNPKLPKSKIVKVDLICGLVKVIVKDTRNKIYWLGTNLGVYGIDFSGNLKFTITNQTFGFEHPISNVKDLLILKNNTQLWIAHSLGVDIFNLVTLNAIKKLPIHPSRITNAVALKQDEFHRVWISTYQGLILYNPSTKDILHYDKGIDLLNQEFNYASSVMLKNGKLIFGGLNGYDIIDPNNKAFDRKSTATEISSIIKISKHDTTQLIFNLKDDIRFENDDEYLEIYIHNKNYINDFDYNFEYSIDDEIWLKTNSINSILINNLSPGKHKLRIRSFENIYDESNIISINIYANSPFYKSTFFAWGISFFSLFAISLYLITLGRLRNIALETKTQIAMDLHDEVGTALTRALFYSRKSKDHVLTNLIESSLNSLRAYIYSMSNKKVKLFELVDDLQEMLNFISIDTDIEVDFKYTELKNETISSVLYRDLKLSFYEIIANNQKHSQCTKFDVRFLLEKSILKINFTDNGILKNIDVLYKNSNGIDNITKRIKRHKGEVKFSINPEGSGLSVDILVLI